MIQQQKYYISTQVIKRNTIPLSKNSQWLQKQTRVASINQKRGVSPSKVDIF